MAIRNAILIWGALGCLASSAQAVTVATLLSDDFAAGAIPNPPYTTITALGGTVVADGAALQIGLTSTPGDKAYIAARDNMSAQYLLVDTATLHITAEVDFSDLVFTPSPDVVEATRKIEYVGILRLMPLIHEQLLYDGPIASVSFGYSDYSRQYVVGLNQRIEYLGAGSTTGQIPVATFNGDRVLTFELTTTVTNVNSFNREWTISNTLNVTQQGVVIASIALNATGKAADSDTTYNPLQHDNLLAVGNFDHSRGDANIELTGGYRINPFSYTLTYDGENGQPTGGGAPAGSGGAAGGGNGAGAPEPGALTALAVGGWVLGRRAPRGAAPSQA